MHSREWRIRETDMTQAALLEKQTGLMPLTVKLLLNRGLDTPEKTKEFLDKDGIALHDPMLLKDMDKAVARLKKAIDAKERVCIYGDYDVDGVTSTVMLYSYLRSKGLECSYFIPERLSDGYGLNLPVIERMKGSVDLVVTVDTGVTAIAEAEFAAGIGIDMIITDHHSCRETLPAAAAVVNPQRPDCEYPFKNLAGVGVVFKLLCALEGDTEKILSLYSDIIAVGTVADVMPIIGENRRITEVGLKKLANTQNAGLLALMREAGIIKPNKGSRKITSATVGYILAPRINAAGRIACASRAVELLLSENGQEAAKIAAELCDINKQRQATEQTIYDCAIELIERDYRDDKFLVLAHEGWHQGVIGVVASKIAEKYSRPCILFSLDGEIAKGSGRSIKGFSLMDALTACGDVLAEYGGHELAAGLSVKRERIDEFRRRINEYACPLLSNSDSALPLMIECEVTAADLTLKGIDEMLMLEPFGLANPQPLLLLREATVRDITPLSMGRHVRFRLVDKRNGGSVQAVYFGMNADSFPFCEGDPADAVFTADVNEYMGSRSVQVFIKTMAPAESEKRRVDEAAEIRERLVSDKALPGDEKHVPALADFRGVFRLLRRELPREGKRISLVSAAEKLREENGADFSLCKLRIALEVLAEQGLIECDGYESNSVYIKLLPAAGKINIDESELLARIRASAAGI
ncbi:MAG: single-stranded-DNA-specific exonuclease RecJ [Clostridia bacterium]|nr:single-stranded-DNA-specific exonuclease RecJ [Clostridia bacterium]